MTYFKRLFTNFLVVFFVNHLVPGINVEYYTRLPHIGGELIFAFGVGLLNSLIFPCLRLFQFSPSYFKLGLISGVISFGAYSIVNLLPVGVRVVSAEGFLWGSLVVWFSGYITNHLEFKRYVQKLEDKYEEVIKKEEAKEATEKKESKEPLTKEPSKELHLLEPTESVSKHKKRKTSRKKSSKTSSEEQSEE